MDSGFTIVRSRFAKNSGATVDMGRVGRLPSRRWPVEDQEVGSLWRRGSRRKIYLWTVGGDHGIGTRHELRGCGENGGQVSRLRLFL